MHLGLSKKTICLAVLVAMMGLLSAPQGLVLCVGDEGHVSIEAAFEVLACQPIGDDTQFASEATEFCNDTPLIGAATRTPGEQKVVWTATLEIIASPPRPTEITAPSLPPSKCPSVLSRRLREHHTIVLLV